jgi:hypothetical protein
MKQGFCLAIAVAVLGSFVADARAQPLPRAYESRAYYYGGGAPPPVYYEPGIPSYEVTGILRATGFLPLGAPVRRGRVYAVSAVHPNGDDGRVVIDAYSGRFIRFVPAWQTARRAPNDEMVLVYQGPNFPPPDIVRPRVLNAPPPLPSARTAPRPPAQVPRLASRTPTATLAVTPKPRPGAAPPKPQTAQAPPTPAPVETKPAAASPPLAGKPVEKSPPAIQPTQPLPPVQTME